MEKNPGYLTEGLSDETLLHILKFIDSHEDFLNLSETCEKLNVLLQDRTFCDKIRFQWHLRVSRVTFTRFLRQGHRSSIITSLTLSDLYWIPSGLMRDLVLGMANLKELHSAGTRLSWIHLQQILKGTSRLEKLSWSWDNNLEESVRKQSSISPTKYRDLIEMKEQFLQLKCLMVHIPMAAKVSTDILFYSFSALAFMISLCKNLEQLWLFSWPKTTIERKCSSDVGREDLEEEDVDLPKLQTLVISVKEPPRIYSPRLISNLLMSLKRNKNRTKMLWLDYPSLGFVRRPVAPANAGIRCRSRNAAGGINSWHNEIVINEAEKISYPMMFHNVTVGAPHIPKLTHLLVTHGAPFIVGLNGVFEDSSELKSFCCSTFNLRVDWKRFAQNHKKLNEVSICESEGLEDYCLSLATLPELRKLSIPKECLLEIKDVQAISEYSINQINHDEAQKLNPTSIGTKRSSISESEPLFKKRRKGAAEQTSNSSGTSRVSGLHVLTAGCLKVTDLEIGLGKCLDRSTQAGRIIVDSLFSIHRWKNLRKLSLNGLPVTNGKFLTKIASACKLESIRLSHLGPSARCCYMLDLCQAISTCRDLRDFRLEQNYIGSTVSLFQSLQNCQNVRRVLIWSSPNDSALEPDAVEDLFEACTDLMMFYATIDSTTKTTCFRMRKNLEAKYRPHRPALSIVIRNTLEDDGLINYPSIHYRQMVMNSPQVCQYNNFPSFSTDV